MKQQLNWLPENNNRRISLIFVFLFLFLAVFVIFEPRMYSINHWLLTHIPPWIAITVIMISGSCLLVMAHNPPFELLQYVYAISVATTLFMLPSYEISVKSRLGQLADLFFGCSVVYWNIVTILRPFLNSRKKEPFPEIKGTYYAREGETWTDEFEHLKVKEELEYELSQEFPDFWSASSHFTKRKKLELLERTAAKFHEKYGCGKMALIVKELKERIESA